MRGIWPDVDIAYRIVNLAAHYDITPEDNELYALWDTATALELPEYTNEERQIMWDKVLELRRRILL